MALGLAVLSGALVGSLGRLSGRLGPRQPFAFGPFIALGIWLGLASGPRVVVATMDAPDWVADLKPIRLVRSRRRAGVPCLQPQRGTKSR